jgi:hypothetical protein
VAVGGGRPFAKLQWWSSVCGRPFAKLQWWSSKTAMVVVRLQNCTWRKSPSMWGKRTRRWHISKSTSRGVCNEDVTLVRGVGKRGARTLQCSRAAAAV